MTPGKLLWELVIPKVSWLTGETWSVILCNTVSRVLLTISRNDEILRKITRYSRSSLSY